jgi:hypothetical protein
MTTTQRIALLAAACLLAVGATACGDDDETATGAADTTTTTVGAPAEPAEPATDASEVVEVVAVDYGFEGLPDTVEAGTRLSLVNEGAEPHELVAMRIPDEEERSVEELLALPQEELFAALGGEGEPEPATVILSAPGATDTPGAVVGDGALVEPGRYAVVCFLPVGSDPGMFDGPPPDGPPEGAGAPHAMHGMWAELTVE